MSIIQLYFSAKGRIRRRDYWFAAIGMGLLALVLEFTAHQLLSGNPPGSFFTDLSGWFTLNPTPFNIFMWVFIVVMAWPGYCLAAKRWQDRNRPGWLAGVLLVLTYVLTFIQIRYGPTDPSSIEGINWPIYGGAAFVSFCLSIWQLVELGFIDGTKGPNTYGPSPKGAEGVAEAF